MMGAAVPAPIFLSPGRFAREWLPPRQKFGLVKLERARKPAHWRPENACKVPAPYQPRNLTGANAAAGSSGAGLARRRGRGGPVAHEPITTDASTWLALTNWRPWR
uniref:Testis cDNA clone: QtsA-11932, similar to human TTK protein kinase (TTK) n=1 Tax=Macaca fascicularis TaxID=9541 RepID=Q4R8P1_MACFA|nr:unnamed protein product [Macaca fascicularis]